MENLKKIRLQQGFTQKDIAQKLKNRCPKTGFRHKKRPPKGIKKYTLSGLYSGISTKTILAQPIFRLC